LNKGKVSWKAAQGAKLKESLRSHWNNRKQGGVNSDLDFWNKLF